MAKLPDHPAGTSPLVIEVVTLFNVCNQCRALRPPSQEFLCLLARRRVVGRHEGGEEAEVGARVLGGNAHNRQRLLPADRLSEIPQDHPLLPPSMRSRTTRGGVHSLPQHPPHPPTLHPSSHRRPAS